MSPVKIFVIYFSGSKGPAFCSEVFQPIMAGACRRPLPEGFIGDDSGDHISGRNRTYGEHTAHYWVLRNYLPRATEDYIGFCHYRRFLDFTPEKRLLNLPQSVPFDLLYERYFTPLVFARWSTADIVQRLEDYDVILPHPLYQDGHAVRCQFDFNHRAHEMDHALDTLRRVCPAYLPQADEVMRGYEFYTCNCFTMRRELTGQYLNWVFRLLSAMEQDHSWDGYERYDDVRMPAFIMERFFSIWLRHQCTRQRLRVLELPGYLLTFTAAEPGLALTALSQGIRMLSSADRQVMEAVCEVFTEADMDLKLCFCMQELRCNPNSRELMCLLHAEPGQPTLRRLLPLLQIAGG